MGVIQSKNDEVTQSSGGKYSVPPILHMINLINYEQLNEEMHVDKNHLNDVMNCAKIEIDDIQEEIDYWNSALVCLFGANPPINVMEGFIRRVWGNQRVDKVALISHGVFMVRSNAMDNRDRC